MRHARATPRHVVIAAWLAVAALGLAVGALGVGELQQLLAGSGAAAAPRTPQTDSDSAFWPGDDGIDNASGQLRDARVEPPDGVPDGLALPGRAPAAEVARDGDYKPFVPTSIRLPSGRVAPIQPVGVHSDGVLEIPVNPDQVGWWTGGAEAGEPYGTTVLAGHVDSAVYGVGFLAAMLKMQPGQVLKLANGKYGQRYLVQSVQKIPKARLAAGTTLFNQDLKHRLVMITCGGPFDRKTHHYRDNVVLTASPIS